MKFNEFHSIFNIYTKPIQLYHKNKYFAIERRKNMGLPKTASLRESLIIQSCPLRLWS